MAAAKQSVTKANARKSAVGKRPIGKLPALLVIIDGFGCAAAGPANAVSLAKTPNINRLYKTVPWTTLRAAGTAVGLPADQEGNSEAGHMNISAGRVVEQDSVTISKQIADGRFFKNAALLHAVHHLHKRKSRIHIMGLLSNGESAHSHPDHLKALLAFFRSHQAPHVYLHMFTDGRDSPPRSALGMMQQLQNSLVSTEKIVSVSGRFWAMDRKKQWDRTQRAYEALVLGRGRVAPSSVEAVSRAYAKNETDEFIIPTVVRDQGEPPVTVQDNDVLIYFNLRSDRARQLTKPFVQKAFHEFRRAKIVRDLLFIAMTDFGPDLGNVVTAYPSPNLTGTLPMALQGLRQLYLAESEKFAHITYFFNGGYADPVAGEERLMIPSPDVLTYDLAPAMATNELADATIERIGRNVYNFIGLNIASPDMVAHTGDLKATITAVESVDRAVGRLIEAMARKGGTVFLTADHGNAEGLQNPVTGGVDTEHSCNPVPFFVISPTIGKQFRLKDRGVLGQVAPTILDTLHIPIPVEMNLSSLWL